MVALGEKLRREREARGVSLREIAVATRIHENYLRALEENDYGALPGAVFVTGFLRNYAVHLGLDADKIVIEFEAMKIESPVTASILPDLVDEESRSPTTWVVGSMFLLLVIYVAYVNWPVSVPEKSKPALDRVVKKPEKPVAVLTEPVKPETENKVGLPDSAGKEQTDAEMKAEIKQVEKVELVSKPPVPAVIKKEPAPEAAVKKKTAVAVKPKKKKKVVARPAAAARPVAVPQRTAVSRKAAVAAEKKQYKYRLVVKAQNEDAWILVVADDEIVRDMFLRPGQKIIIKGNDSINFTTGNASQIKLTLNGNPLNFEVPKNNVLRSWNIPLPETE